MLKFYAHKMDKLLKIVHKEDHLEKIPYPTIEQQKFKYIVVAANQGSSVGYEWVNTLNEANLWTKGYILALENVKKRIA